MAKTQYYGLRYPFTSKDNTGYFVDLDIDSQNGIKSEIMHIIFTPKGQRLRDPEFGTDLIKFIFNPNDNESWGDIKEDIRSAISRSIPNVTLKDIEIIQDGLGGVNTKIQYTVDKGAYVSEDTIITKI